MELENRHSAIASKRMDLIADTSIISDYDKLETVVMTSKNARKLQIGFEHQQMKLLQDFRENA